jgi:hypothetical protein
MIEGKIYLTRALRWRFLISWTGISFRLEHLFGRPGTETWVIGKRRIS